MDLNDNSPENFCKCGTKKTYSNEFDAYYCEKCNEWLEDICNDRDCGFCNERPLKPVNKSNA